MAHFNFRKEYQAYLVAVCGRFAGEPKQVRTWYDSENVLHFYVDISCIRFNSYRFDEIKTAVNKIDLDLVGFDFFMTSLLLELHFVLED